MMDTGADDTLPYTEEKLQDTLFASPEYEVIRKSITHEDIVRCMGLINESFFNRHWDKISGFIKNQVENQGRGVLSSYADIFRETAESVKSAPIFEFGSYEPSEEHGQFAADLVEKKLFRLPFETIIVRADVDKISRMLWIVMEELVPSEQFIVIINSPVAKHEVIPRAVVIIDAGENSNISPIPIFGDSIEEDEAIRQYCAHIASSAFGLIVSLMSEGVGVDSVIPDARLQKARAKRNKSPLPTRYIVSIDPKSRNRIETDDGVIDLEARTHASPKPHWRRGHFRTLRSKMVVPVAPCAVGAGGDVSELGKRMYQLVKDGIRKEHK